MPQNAKTSGGKGGSQPRGRRRRTRYGVQLQEKQNLKNIFGARERQLKRYYREALAAPAETGPFLVQLLELRLDNALYRSGIAETRAQARQMASHKLLQVNGRTVSTPSLRLKKGDVISVKDSKKNKSYFNNFIKRMQNVSPPSWLELRSEELAVRVAGEPTPEEARLGVDIQGVVEFLSR